MGLFKYKIKAICDNCGSAILIKIPNGITIREYLKSGEARCSYCKCNAFSKFINNYEPKSNNERS